MDQQHGAGSMTYSNGNLVEGSWRYGQQHGVFIFTFPNGDKYQTGYDDGLRQGAWTEIEPIPHDMEIFQPRK